MAFACLARISPWSTVLGARVAVHACTANDRRITGLDGHIWEPAIVTPPTLGISLFNGDFQTPVSAGGAVLPINMEVLKNSYPNADTYVWTGAPVEIYAGQSGQAWPYWRLVFSGTISGFNRKAQVLTISADVNEQPFEKDILTAAYAGTGDAEGDADLKGKVKPLAIGRPLNVEPVLINAVDSVYQFSAYGPIEAVTTLYERGSDFGAEIGDYADYDALVAATIPAGSWATCLAEGMIRLGAPAYGVITGDIRGHVGSGVTSPRLTGAIIAELAEIAGVDAALIEQDTLDELDRAVPYPISVVLEEQTSFIEMARALALACNAQTAIGLTGTMFVSRVSLDAAEVATFNAQGRSLPEVIESDELDVSVPYRKTVMGANRCWRVHSADEIATSADLVERGLYDDLETYREGNIVELPSGSRWLYINATASAGNDPPVWPTTSNAWWENLTPPLTADNLTYVDGTAIEDLKPAEVGATEGAPPGTPVGTITADDVDSTINSGGGVADDQVATAAMQANAATLISSFFKDYNAAWTIGSTGTWVTIDDGSDAAEISIATGPLAGQKVMLKAYVGIRRAGGSNDNVEFRVRRDGSTVLAQTWIMEATNDKDVLPMAFVDASPTANTTHTYALQMKSDDSATPVYEVMLDGMLGKTG